MQYRENKLGKVNVPFDFDGTFLSRSHPQRPVHLAHSGTFCVRKHIHCLAFNCPLRLLAGCGS